MDTALACGTCHRQLSLTDTVFDAFGSIECEECADKTADPYGDEWWKVTLICQHCRREFRMTQGGRRYCSRPCAVNARTEAATARRPPRTDAACQRCGTMMPGARTDARYCSSACRQAAYRDRR